jgi:alpha-ribazole phosphatase
MRLFLATHAQTDWNVQGRFQGHTDVPLNERGRSQAAALGQRLAQEKLHAIVASDLCRARQTAEIVALAHGMGVRTDARLRELCFGAWEGLTHAEIQQQYPNELAAWRKDILRTHPRGGECLLDLAARLREFVKVLGNYPQEADVLVVAHRGALRTLLCLLLDRPIEAHWDFHLEIASLTELEIAHGKARLVHLNQTVGKQV